MHAPTTDWHVVDRYVTDALGLEDGELTDALHASAEAGLPAIDVSAPQGQMLALFARMIDARSILEIGTLGGYSTIHMARALPADGHLVTIELDQDHADIARANLNRAGYYDSVEILVGPAIDLLPGLEDDTRAPFDMVFIDADKASMPEYLRWAMRLTRSGSVIVCDNVVREGSLVDGDSDDPSVRGARGVHEFIAAEPRLAATTIQTVGSKGWDGFTLALVVDPA